MSGQWEIVGKKRDKASKLPVAKTNNNAPKTKKVPVNNLKIEEILPKSEVQSLYSSNKSNKENKKPNEKNKVQENSSKKTQKKEKTQEIPKPKPPKSIESALNAIDLEEFETLFAKNQSHFPDAPIIWLKELVQFLNQKMSLEIHDPVFSTKKEGYPLNVVPSGIKSVMERAISQAGKNNTQLFFDICLTSMASDMSKDLSALGNKIFLQYIAVNEPLLISENLNKYIILKNSYQNRPNIGLSILWSVGHVGIKNIQCGLEVFEQLFLPLIEMKNYSRYICSYLLNLLSKKDITITKEQYLLLVDTIHTNKKNFPVDLKNELAEKISDLKPTLFSNKKEKFSNLFDVMFKKILVNSNKPYQDCLCDILIDVFHKDESTLSSWSKIYSKNVAASAILLKYLGDNWNVAKKINKTALSNLLDSFELTNVELSTKKNITGVKESAAAIRAIKENMVAKSGSASLFKTFLITSLLLSQIILAVVLYEALQSGKWDGDLIKQKLKKFGLYPVYEYLEKAGALLGEGYSWIAEKLEESFPGYRETIKNAMEPYVDLFIKIGKLICVAVENSKEAIIEKYPIMLQNIEYYAPGLIETSQKAISNAYSTSAFYLHSSVDYLREKVFIGNLSPENVQRVVTEALNTTQHKASEYYHWIYEKVQTTIK